MHETVGRFDAVVAGIFVRTASFSGRMDLDEDLVAFLRDLAEDTAQRGQPLVVVLFGNPYVARSLPELPSVLLTYDYRGLSETTAAKAIAGEIPIRGRLPVSLDEEPSGRARVDAAPCRRTLTVACRGIIDASVRHARTRP